MAPAKVKKHSSKPNLPIIKCVCGHEILLLPDSKNLGKTFEEHALEHKKKYMLTQKEADAIKDNLIAQVLKIASEIEAESSNISNKPVTKKKAKENSLED